MKTTLKGLALEYNNEQHMISKYKIEKYELEFISDVLKYATEVFDLKLPMEIAHKGKILSSADEIPADAASKENSLKLYLKFIKDPAKSTVSEDYFRQRDIPIEFGISLDCSFEVCVLKVSQLQKVPDNQIEAVKKSYLLHGQKNEQSKGYIITRFLEEALSSEDISTYSIQAGVSFSIPGQHISILDHFIYNKKNHRAVLISEDKNLDMFQGMLQNFDQLLTYSLTAEGAAFKYFYGIVSNLKEWRFCCYIRPDEERVATKNNFKVSKIINLNIEKDGSPATESIRTILQTIKGFLSNDVDKVVENELKVSN